MFRPDEAEHFQDLNRSVIMDALIARASGDGEEYASGLPQELRPIVRRLQDSYDQLKRITPPQAWNNVASLVGRITDELMVDGWSPTAAKGILRYYEEVPVSPGVFLSDPYYAGDYGEGLYPVNFRDLCWLASPSNGIIETIFTGSVRWGKTLCAVYILAYRLYLLSLLREPQVYFGLARASSIRYGIFSLFKYKTNEMEDRFRVIVDKAPYFKERFPRLNQKQSRQLRFPKNISILVGSTELALLGETLIGAVLDEINFMASPSVTKRSRVVAREELGQAQKLYTALRSRLHAQFVRHPGMSAPYFMCLMSERRAQTDFLEQHIKDHGGDPGVAVISRAIWDVQPPGTYKLGTFRVFCGDTLNAPRILTETDKLDDDTNSVDVPEEHRQDFEDNLENAIRRLAGRATVAASNLFGRPEVLGDAFDEQAIHPFTQEEIVLSTGDEIQISDYVREDLLFIPDMSGKIPRLDRDAHRVMHIDLSSTGTPTGMACIHMHEHGLEYKVVVDFMLRINPPLKTSGHEIDYDKIIDFILYLQKNGFTFKLISFDKYQSRHSHQILQKLGIDVAYISVDETDDPYVNLKGLFESHRISMYNYPPVVSELRHLEHDITLRKVFKPANACFAAGTKVALLDGRSVPIESLVAEYKKKPFYVYTIRGGKVDVGIARNARLTKKRAKTVVVTLDSGEKITCTPDHRFMLRSGSYRRASSLRTGTSLMPLVRRLSKHNMVGYEQYKCPSDGKWHFTHRTVGRWKYGKEYTGNQYGAGVIHHEKGKLNNDPNHLELVGSKVHGIRHAADLLARRADPAFEGKRRRRAVAYARSPEGREFSRQNLQKLNTDPVFAAARDKRASALGKRTGTKNITRYNKSEKHRKVASEIGKRTIHYATAAQRGKPHWWSKGALNHMYRADVTVEKLAELCSFLPMQKDILQRLDCTKKVVYRVLREHGETWPSFREKHLCQNHKVVSVVPGPVTNVYDISVPGTQNFALSVGVFVHNSKDVSDALAGSCYGLIPERTRTRGTKTLEGLATTRAAGWPVVPIGE